MTIDFSRPLETNHGHKVKIYEEYDHFIHGAIKVDDRWHVVAWSKMGHITRCEFGNSKDYDLINVPETITAWINVYNIDDSYSYIAYDSKDIANQNGRDRIARVKIKFKEGQVDE